MLFLRSLLFFMFLVFVDVVIPLQINLDLTEWTNGSENDVVLRHDCLHVMAWTGYDDDVHKVIAYCLSEWPSQWNIQNNDLDKKLTFLDLFKLNITSEELYLWSAPIDVVENYQLYLDEPSTTDETSMAMYRYYNCTLPRFGPLCQYSFDHHQLNHSSLIELILHAFSNSRLKLKNQTCYTHLQCNLGLSLVCIGWSNICDGIIQCIDGIDEEHCWQLDIHRCKENEYRYDNAQCIPWTFLRDNKQAPDCFDGSDEDFPRLQTADFLQLSFKYEDLLCYEMKNFYGSIEDPIVSKQCSDAFGIVFPRLLFSERPKTLSDLCSLAVTCYFCFPNPLISNCDKICVNESCKEIIEVNCPEMFYMPETPVTYGHIYFAYTKKYILERSYDANQPEYICYNAQLCAGFDLDGVTISFNNTTCRRPEDFPLDFAITVLDHYYRWFISYAFPIIDQLWRCNTILRNDSWLCDNSTMYQCENSSKCITRVHLLDVRNDCDYDDDEYWTSADGSCPANTSQMHVKCPNATKCVQNVWDTADSREHLSFAKMCDRFLQLKPMLIDDHYETDETNCGQWACNNSYTRCDGIWHCWDGADEVDCYPSSLLKCPPYHHICVSSETWNFTCLPMNKTNNGEVDCLGAIDERTFCEKDLIEVEISNFYCEGYDSSTCISHKYVCDGRVDCKDSIDEHFCSDIVEDSFNPVDCGEYTSIVSDVKKFLCKFFGHNRFEENLYFSLDKTKKSGVEVAKPSLNMSTGANTSQSYHQCHRSLNVRVWLNATENSSNISCLCSPNYYGDKCQYQNERVSLNIRFRTFSDSWRTPFTVIVMLIDDDDQRTIHSFEQFTYLSLEHCRTKFHIDLLYSTRPKNQSKEYSVHIDIYEKLSLEYRGSLLLPISFPFLPVERISMELDIPPSDGNFKNCSDPRCIHGQCMRYFADAKKTTFCQCDRGWSGRYCTISHTCTYSSDSLCLGILANNRSLCICPFHKWDPRCVLHDQICQSNTICRNDGQCIPADRSEVSIKNFICICLQGFSGERCEIRPAELILSFDQNMTLPESMLIHFIEIKEDASSENGATLKMIPANRDRVTAYWSRPFHIIFIEVHNTTYYLVAVRRTYIASVKIEKTLTPSDHCPNIDRVFNESIVKLHLLRRIKCYHLPCQNSSPRLSCFHDDLNMCLCYDFGGQRIANCFEFNQTIKRNCRGHNKCERDAECLQDTVSCPQRSTCICRSCTYGTLCQFSSSGFGSSLDAIIGDSIQPHIGMSYQPIIVKISVTLTIIIAVMGFINGILAIITFMNEEPRKTGCGLYLIASSITILITIVIFSTKFGILLVAQMTYVTNRSMLHFQCRSLDFLLRVGLNMNQWLNACVALERAIIITIGIVFDKDKGKAIAKITIPILLLLIIGTNIHEIIYRRPIDSDSNDEKRIWCVVTFSSPIQTFHLFVNIFHFCTPFLINLSSAILIIVKTARLRTATKANQSYRQVLFEQFQQHKHLIITPLLLVILALPRLIISFVFTCMKSNVDSWLFLMGYMISFIPPTSTFLIFVLPSEMYKEEFRKTVKRHQRSIRTWFRFCR